MGIRDNQLDVTISLALETQTIVTSRQKNMAWEHLHERAAQQVILTPYAIPPCSVSHQRSRLYRLTVGVLRSVVALLADDSVYHRAAANRQVSAITRTIGTELVIHYYPLRAAHRYAI